QQEPALPTPEDLVVCTDQFQVGQEVAAVLVEEVVGLFQSRGASECGGFGLVEGVRPGGDVPGPVQVFQECLEKDTGLACAGVAQAPVRVFAQEPPSGQTGEGSALVQSGQQGLTALFGLWPVGPFDEYLGLFVILHGRAPCPRAGGSPPTPGRRDGPGCAGPTRCPRHTPTD